MLPDTAVAVGLDPPGLSQCTYRCMVLPDESEHARSHALYGSQCTYRCVVLPDRPLGMNYVNGEVSQCTYRCVVLPDWFTLKPTIELPFVSMHLQVRGAP